MLDSLNQKQKIIFFLIFFIMILFILYYLYLNIYQKNNTLHVTNTSFIETPSTNASDFNSIDNNSSTIIVYVCGAVKNEDVICISSNSRIIDAINAAGGLEENADLSNINLAEILEDGEKIYIPKEGEISSETDSNKNIATNSTNKKTNINKASQTELESLPGIGPSTALKIIEYREKNGKFSSIDEIKNVSGIGDSKFTQIESLISIK